MTQAHIVTIPLLTTSRTSSIWFDVDRSLSPMLSMAVMIVATFLLVLGTRLPQQVALPIAADDFRTGVERYVELRQRIEGTMAVLRVTTDPAEILGREKALGSAIRAARPDARQGEIFSAATAPDFRRIIAADRSRRSAGDQAAIMSEVPPAFPGVNEPYPAMSPLATFPPLLLAALPRLADDLEYRFMGRQLVIRDTRTNLVVDYLSDGAPFRLQP